jgi:heat shock protein HslJ
MARKLKVFAAVVVAAVFLAAVSGGSLADPLNGTKWKLTEWTISSIDPASVTITASFTDGQIGGNSGVNSYGGPYSVGLGGSITLGALAMTEMAGPEPAMRGEQVYHALLAEVGSFKAGGGRLTLYDKNGNESLIFAAVSE